MRICYALSRILPSSRGLFLAGPTPRDASVVSGRPEAPRLIESLGFDGTVYLPEYFDRAPSMTETIWSAQVDWEHEAMASSKVIAFWVPRSMAGGMPGLTTNVEFGYHVRFRRPEVMLGAP